MVFRIENNITVHYLKMTIHQHPVAVIKVLRCMRCARSVEATSTDDVRSLGMLRIGYNLYYCEQCAKIVGFEESM